MNLIIDMAPMTYKCCRCRRPLPAGEVQQPWPCSDGCGEWLTPEAIDAHLLPAVLISLRTEPGRGAPRCAFCERAMQAFHGEPYHLCLAHGVWFDKDDRQSFARVLSAEIARHREARRQRDAEVSLFPVLTSHLLTLSVL